MITTNLKKGNNQNCQKIELYGSPTTKELKKHSSRLVGGAEMESQSGQGGSWQTGISHICLQISQEEQLGSKTEQDHATQGSSAGNQSLKSSVKTCGGCGSGKKSRSHRILYWRDPHDPRTYISPPRNWHLKEHNPLVESEGSD